MGSGDVPQNPPRGTSRVSGKQNSLFPSGPFIKCLLIHRPRPYNKFAEGQVLKSYETAKGEPNANH